MKIIHKLLLVPALACACLPVVRGRTITAEAKEDLGYYPMACSAYEVDTVSSSGTFVKKGCYNDYASALSAMKKQGDDGVVRHGQSYSQTKIIAMNNGAAFAYPFRGGTSMMYYYQDISFSSSYASTYSGQHYQAEYFETPVYNGDGTGKVRLNLNGFDGYAQLRDVDLVPVAFFEKQMNIVLGGNETFYNTPEKPYDIIPKMNTFVCVENGNYKDMLFNSYYGWPDSTGYSMQLNKDMALPAADWMEPGTTYYSYNGTDFYTDQAFHNYAGQFYNYYQFLPLRSKSNLKAEDFEKFLKDLNITSSSKLYGAGQYFIDAQNDYGINALMIYAMACLESAYGTSSYAMNRNNFFGWGAVDSNPGQAAYFASVEEGIRTQFSTNLAGFLDMDDWRYYGSMVGSKGAGFNLKYASAVYWGMQIASIAYRIDKCSCGYNGQLTDKDTVTIGIVNNKDANASLTYGGKTDYNCLSCNLNYFPVYPVAVLEEKGDYYRTQCTNYVVDGKIYYIKDSSCVRNYDWVNSAGWFGKSDVTLISTKTLKAETPLTGEPVQTLDSIVLENTTITLAGKAYREGILPDDSNIPSVTVRIMDRNLKETVSAKAEITAEKDAVSWRVSFDLAQLDTGIWYFNTEYTYSKAAEYGGEYYLKSENVPDETVSSQRRYAFVSDDKGFVRLEITQITCGEGSHYDEELQGCIADPAEPEPDQQEPAPAETAQPAELPEDDALLMRGIDSAVFDSRKKEITIHGAAFFEGLASDGNGEHTLVLVDMETHEETLIEATTDDCEGLIPGCSDAGFKAVLDLKDISSGNYYLRIRLKTNEREGEGALFSNAEGLDQSVIKKSGEIVRFFANPLSNYRLEVSCEKQTLDLIDTKKASRMTSLFAYQKMEFSGSHLIIDGLGIMYNASMSTEDNVSYRLYLEDEEGMIYAYDASAKESGIDYASVIHSSKPLTAVSFDADLDLGQLPEGNYRIYMEITTNECHDIFEIYSISPDEIQEGIYRLKTTGVRSRYILTVGS